MAGAWAETTVGALYTVDGRRSRMTRQPQDTRTHRPADSRAVGEAVVARYVASGHEAWSGRDERDAFFADIHLHRVAVRERALQHLDRQRIEHGTLEQAT
jgi:hypothetical protein